MKTIEKISEELNLAMIDFGNVKHKKGVAKNDLKKLQEKIDFLRFVKLYLQSSPTEESIRRQRDDTQKRITFLENNFENWKRNNRDRLLNCSSPVSKYNKVFDMNRLKEQLKTTNYLLS